MSAIILSPQATIKSEFIDLFSRCEKDLCLFGERTTFRLTPQDKCNVLLRKTNGFYDNGKVLCLIHFPEKGFAWLWESELN